ncbi:hypothetical protein BDF22DRAFT_680872, partial [Syncephalis plumigaleata]
MFRRFTVSKVSALTPVTRQCLLHHTQYGIVQRNTLSTALLTMRNNIRMNMVIAQQQLPPFYLPSQSTEIKRYHSEFKPHDWVCGSCSAHNFAKRNNCWECGKPKSDSVDPNNDDGDSSSTRRRSASRPGDWTCPDCKFENFASRHTCLRCKAERPMSSERMEREASVRARLTVPKEWKCKECGHDSHIAYASCVECGYPRNRLQEIRDKEAEMLTAIRKRSSDWLCGSCGSHNYVSRIVCRDCSMPYDNTALPVPPMPEADWECTRCGTENRNTRFSCIRCRQRAPHLTELLKTREQR